MSLEVKYFLHNSVDSFDEIFWMTENQNRCRNNTGTKLAAGSKKEVPILRSVNKIVMAPAFYLFNSTLFRFITISFIGLWS